MKKYNKKHNYQFTKDINKIIILNHKTIIIFLRVVNYSLCKIALKEKQKNLKKIEFPITLIQDKIVPRFLKTKVIIIN